MDLWYIEVGEKETKLRSARLSFGRSASYKVFKEEEVYVEVLAVAAEDDELLWTSNIEAVLLSLSGMFE